MGVLVSRVEMLGNGQVQVFARTDKGNDIDAVMGHDKLNTGTMYAILGQRAKTVDAQVAALDARRGRTEHD